MIEYVFEFLEDKVIVRVDGHNITFGYLINYPATVSIDYLRLNRDGVIKEFPDLKENINWRDEAIKRFKDKIKSLDNEDKIGEYLVNDLKKYGYLPLYRQISGRRPEKYG